MNCYINTKNFNNNVVYNKNDNESKQNKSTDKNVNQYKIFPLVI